jgi:hypothetical protein
VHALACWAKSQWVAHTAPLGRYQNGPQC